MTSSFFSQLLFHWFTPLAWKGFRKPLEYPDLWDLNPLDRSKQVVARFDAYYPHHLNKAFLAASAMKWVNNFNICNDGIDSILIKICSGGTSKEPEREDMSIKFVSGSPPEKEVTVLWSLIKGFGRPYLFAIFLKFIPVRLEYYYLTSTKIKDLSIPPGSPCFRVSTNSKVCKIEISFFFEK